MTMVLLSIGKACSPGMDDPIHNTINFQRRCVIDLYGEGVASLNRCWQVVA